MEQTLFVGRDNELKRLSQLLADTAPFPGL